ncbi:MAG: hypothetical protein BECKG1743E_GA0114224_113081, partial [Candidatus Kentron sp. G]
HRTVRDQFLTEVDFPTLSLDDINARQGNRMIISQIGNNIKTINLSIL